MSDLPDPSTLALERVMLASEGRRVSESALDYAAQLAEGGGGRVFVLSIARIWGTSFGLPNPGLLPSKGEWEEQRELVDRAVKRLRKRGLHATGRVIGTRRATKRIVDEAERLDCQAIVMSADPPRNRLVADLMWTQEPYRVRRRAKLPVYLVTD